MSAQTGLVDRAREEKNELVYNYKKLRAAIGWLGISLPITTGLGAWLFFQTKLQGSISSYYYTGMRDVFVGTLWAIGFFLVAYKGYTRSENWLGNVACVFAVLISIFPTRPEANASAVAMRIGYVHTGSAACFFAILAVFAFQFTRTDQPLAALSPEKRNRNRVYRVCGSLLAVCIVLMALTVILPSSFMDRLAAFRPIYVLETVGILAFGVSWLVKGEAILGDKPDSVSTLSHSAGNA
jgi:hypothetical protein